MGVFQGLTVSEMHEKFPKERQDYERICFEYTIPEGESLRQLRQRSFRVLTAIAKLHLEDNVVVVTHGTVLTVFFQEVLGVPTGNTCPFKVDHWNFCTFEYVGEQWSLIVWNDLSHLENMETLKNTSISLV